MINGPEAYGKHASTPVFTRQRPTMQLHASVEVIALLLADW